MSLLGFQTALGREVRATPGAVVRHDDLDLTPQERRGLAAIVASPGFRATMKVQRSWSEGRAAGGARLTLSLLPLAQRRQLVRHWVDAGGGTNSFFPAEAGAFLAFIAPQLPSPSHALSVCLLEQAVLSAEAAAADFCAPDPATLQNTTLLAQASTQAALIAFHGELDQVLMAAEGHLAPPLTAQPQFVLVAPGLAGLACMADAADVDVWQALQQQQTVATLLQQHDRARIEALWTCGALVLASSCDASAR